MFNPDDPTLAKLNNTLKHVRREREEHKNSTQKLIVLVALVALSFFLIAKGMDFYVRLQALQLSACLADDD